MKRVLPALLATAVLGALVLAFLDLDLAEMGHGVADRLRALAPVDVALAFAVYLASYFGRAVRFAVLLPGLRGIVHLASIAGRHNFLNLVLPFRTGELALPWMLHKECGRPLSQGSAALLVCRVLDLGCVAAWLAIGIAWYGVGGPTAEEVTPRVLGVLAALAAGLLLMGPVAKRVAARLDPDAPGRVRGFLARATGHLATLSIGRLLLAGLVSLATWLLTYSTYWFMVRGMAGPDPVGLELGDVPFARGLVGTTGLHLSTVLPVNTLGGVGSWEAGWVAGYTLLAGIGKEAAGVSAVVTHLLNFVFITVIGGAGFLLRRSAPRPAAGEASPDAPSGS